MKLKIAQLVPAWMSFPPEGFGGLERVVYDLTEGLVKNGHEVTLFSVGDSKTSAELNFVYKEGLGLQDDVMSTLKTSFSPLIHVANCFEQYWKFDIIHSHAQFLALPFAAIVSTSYSTYIP